MSRSVNKVILVGNIVKDALLKDSNKSRCVLFTVATNRSWRTDNGERHEEAEFHRIIAWDKLADIIYRFGQKGKRVFVEGRLATRQNTPDVPQPTYSTEIVASDVIFLDNLKGGEGQNGTSTTDASREIS